LCLLSIGVFLHPKSYTPHESFAPPVPDAEPVLGQNHGKAEVPEEPRFLIMEATAYTKSPEEGTADGITATGHRVRRGVVAVDPSVIPLGTKLYVEGYGEAVALDTGGAIKGMRIDLYMDTKKEAFEWGRRKVKVYFR